MLEKRITNMQKMHNNLNDWLVYYNFHKYKSNDIKLISNWNLKKFSSSHIVYDFTAALIEDEENIAFIQETAVEDEM